MKTLDDAHRQFIDQHGRPLVVNAWLQLGMVVALAFGVAGWVFAFRAQNAAAHLKPLVVRIDAVGRADAVAYDAATWTPQEPELRYFLTRFLELHLSRMRATIRRDFPASLFFIPERDWSAHLRTVETFVNDQAKDDVEVHVDNIAFTDLEAEPFKVSADLEQTTFARGTRHALSKRRATATLTFTILPATAVPNGYQKVNPFGVQITQLRVDEAFNTVRKEGE
jgi:type IV secretory pathway TrbF-like protein